MPPKKRSPMDSHPKSPEYVIGAAFHRAHGLRDRCLEIARKYWQSDSPSGEVPDLLCDISRFILSLDLPDPPSDYTVPNSQENGVAEPSPKKRKLEEETTDGRSKNADFLPSYELKDISVTAPLRKKMRLQIARDGSSAASEARRQLRLLDSKTGSVEYALRAEDVEHMFMLPVPDKAQRLQNFLLFPKEGLEPVLWTVGEVKGIPEVGGGEESNLAEAMRSWLDYSLTQGQMSVVVPTKEEFASEIVQAHRKGEKAYHVKAFKGSKEGYLFFLPTGIVFGFKKPLQFFPFSDIESTAFTSVLQRTFNLVITTARSKDADQQPTAEEDYVKQEHEFSMIDTAEFAGIDAYIRNHGLNDASMAADRRAKMHNVNKVKGEDGQEGVAVGGEDGELAKAEQQLQDEEDEEEEDYDPGDEEDSEGEGVSSEGEEEGEGEGYEIGDGEVEEMEEEEQ